MESKKHKELSKEEVEKYLDSSASSEEKNSIEKKALKSDFSSEALEGLEDMNKAAFSKAMEDIQSRLSERSSEKKVINWYVVSGIVASILLIVSTVFYVNESNDRKSEIALQEKLEKEAPQIVAEPQEEVPEEVIETPPDLADNEKEIEPKPSTALIETPQEETVVNNPQKIETPDVALSEKVESKNVIALQESILTEAEIQTEPLADIQEAKSSAPSALQKSAGGITTANNIIKGKIISGEDGSPLPGVNIILKGTTTGAISDKNGNYEIEIPVDRNGSLVYSFIGLERREVEIGDKSEIDVSLNADVAELSEVVVTGVGRSSFVAKKSKSQEKAASPFADREAAPINGYDFLKEYIAENKKAKQAEVGDYAIISFEVKDDSKLTNFKVIEETKKDLGKEAIRLIKKGPNWFPAIEEGVAVKKAVELKVDF